MTTKILIIDDDPVVVNYLDNLFRDNGYETETAENAIEGLEIVKKTNPDLITLDLQMPNHTGTDFYRRLLKHKELSKIPIIVVSGLGVWLVGGSGSVHLGASGLIFGFFG